MERVRVHFRGRVQGVGFRYTASRFAHSAGISGEVRNMPDGGVELVAEADTKTALEQYIDRLARRFNCTASVNYSERPQGLTEFEIRYGPGAL